MDKKKMNSFDPTKVIVSVINLDVSDDGMDCHSALESVEKAFYEYMKNPFARNQSSKCSNQEESRQQIQEIKKRVMNASYIWMLNYKKQSRKSSFSLDDSLPKVYEIEKSDDSKVNLIKSKMKIPFSSKRLYLKGVPSSVENESIVFVPLENLIWEREVNDESISMPIMYFKKFKGLKNCYANKKAFALFEKDNSVVSRYITYRKFKDLVEQRKLSFLSPNRWEDPFEKIYFNSSIRLGTSIEEKTTPQVVSLCFTKSKFDNSVALWKNFRKSEDERLVRIAFNFRKLLNQLSSLLEKRQMKLYVSAVEYSLNSKSIKNADTFTRKILEDMGNLDSYDTDMLYLSMLSYKRKAFRFEKEIRFFIVPENGQFSEDDCKYGVYDVNSFEYSGIVEKVWLEPIRLPSGWVSKEVAIEEMGGFSIKESKIYSHREKNDMVIFPIKKRREI